MQRLFLYAKEEPLSVRHYFYHSSFAGGGSRRIDQCLVFVCIECMGAQPEKGDFVTRLLGTLMVLLRSLRRVTCLHSSWHSSTHQCKLLRIEALPMIRNQNTIISWQNSLGYAGAARIRPSRCSRQLGQIASVTKYPLRCCKNQRFPPWDWGYVIPIKSKCSRKYERRWNLKSKINTK